MSENVGPESAVLERLLETCRDGEAGFRKCAEHTRDLDLRTLFADLAQQRAAFATELGVELRSRGAEPPDGRGLAARLQQGWMELKEALGGGNQALLDSAEQGEDVAVATYAAALAASGLDADLRTMIARQASDVREAHARIREIRDARRAAPSR